MIRPKKLVLTGLTAFLFAIGLIVSGCSAPGPAAGRLPDPFQLIPMPRSVELGRGAGLEPGSLKALCLEGGASRPVTGPSLSSLLLTKKDGEGVLVLRLCAEPGPSEGYRLAISDGKASITASGRAGLFYGCRTLEQLLEDAGDRGIPACTIIDSPALSFRAVHIDVKHHLDTMKYYYDSIDRLSRYKINAVIFEFEDKLRYRRRPAVGAPQAIGIDEMAALTRYARKRHIEINPLVQGLGHASFILKHDEFKPYRENPDDAWVFCPLHEETYEILFDLYRDAIDATPGSRYLHVGGDEIGRIGACARCRPYAEKNGIMGLNLYWLDRVCRFATGMGRIPIFWDDMPLKHAGVYRSTCRDDIDAEALAEIWDKGLPRLDGMIDRFPKNCVYMRWNYTPGRQPGNIRALDWYRERGLRAMIATAAQNTSALLPRDDRVDVIQSFIRLASERGITGMLCTAWDDSSPHMETYWRGLIASAEYSWNPEGRSLEEYETAYLHRSFGPECAGAVRLYADLFEGVEFWRRALLSEGERVYNPKKMMDLPDTSAPGKWSALHKERLDLAGKEALRYERTSRQLEDLLGKARRNRYHLELLSAVNDFQAMAPHLLLALKKADSAPKIAGLTAETSRKEGRMEVERALDRFDGAWRKLRDVYSETRFIESPPGYVKDRYFHFASQREDLSWLVQVEEKFHEKVRTWLERED